MSSDIVEVKKKLQDFQLYLTTSKTKEDYAKILYNGLFQAFLQESCMQVQKLLQDLFVQRITKAKIHNDV